MQSLNYKRIGLIVAVVISMTATWAVAHAWLGNPDRFSSLIVMLWPALVFVGSSAIVGVAFMLQEHRADRLAAIVASWAVFIVFWTPDIWYVSALPIFLGFWWFASREIRHDLGDRHTIRVSGTLDRGMKLILLGSFLMVSLGFYLLPSQQPTLTTVSRSIQSSVIDNPFVQQQLPSGSRSQFAQYIDQMVRTWLGPVRQFIPPILAFGLFLTLWSVNVLLRVPAVWVGQGLFSLLRWSGFVKIEEKDVKAEVLSL